MSTSSAQETFLVVASTDLERAQIMTTRIRQQLGKDPGLMASGELEVSAQAVTMPDLAAGRSLDEQVNEVANAVTEMVRGIL